MSYSAPLQEFQFVLQHLADLQQINQLPAYTEATPDTVQAILEEQAKFVHQEIAPLNVIGDRQPSAWRAATATETFPTVTTSPGFQAAFHAFAAAGWQGLQHPVEHGGQGLPKLVAMPCMEMLNAANLSFALCPLLTDGAIEALLLVGSDAQKKCYLPRLIDGTWTGTMNLTEAQAGSDLSLVRTQAVPQADGMYRLHGQKIFITYGEHDLAENIIHLVLARTPHAPEGVRGLSLFIVPKYVVNADGSMGARNEVECVSLEHKLGIKASPTAVLQFGTSLGALGSLVGEANRGLEYMFIMMNAARFAVGVQGVGLAERAYQQAVAYARERVQSRPVDGSAAHAVAIVQHPDVRRMLLLMRAQIEAARALAAVTAAARDIADHHGDAAIRTQQQAFYEFMVPVVKGWGTETALDVTSLALQIHGGMGFIEETGVAQYYRDARILTIYEGTTAIQANDLLARKILRDRGATARAVVAHMLVVEAQLAAAITHTKSPGAQIVLPHLRAAREAFETLVIWLVDNAKAQPNAVYAGAVTTLKLTGMLMGGWQMARALLAAEGLRARHDTSFDGTYLDAKNIAAQFYAQHILAQVPMLAHSVRTGAESILNFPLSAF